MIQLKLVFELENTILPLEMERVIVSFLKATIQNYSNDMFERLYSKKRSIMKTYTFSKYLPDATFCNQTIQLSQNRFVVFFSDSNFAQLLEFYNAFVGMRLKKYPMEHNSMKLIQIVTQKRHEIADNEIVVKMQSPLIVRRHDGKTNKDQYYCFHQEEFSEVVKENVVFFVNQVMPELSMEGFSIVPVKGKKVVVPNFGTKIDGNLGIYKITGSKELLNILYLAGIGARRSSGNGKFELLW
ncbi:MAG: CRISPR-associated endoribonuclease Cas6 [Firmicutes bacterium]|uniref:CRISPR-associated endoribonuclease Cas6 n=1 Tax=Candidatus Scybalomonas excrementavium TaxID=2840943 RepID=A0A9D9I166_9FIRM|nr:CRISPR-associated endoribonuclease Cas6 [Candidatus Scybalomonas excrementavium]